MSQPITVESTGFSAAGSYCTIVAPAAIALARGLQLQGPLVEDITWTVQASATVSGNFTAYWVLQELGSDNVFRTMRFPAGQFIYANAFWTGKLEARLPGVQLLLINSIGTGNIAFARISATIRGF